MDTPIGCVLLNKNMKVIKLTKGFEAIVDDQDYELVSQYHWYFDKYARGSVKGKKIGIHNLIMNAQYIDHINGDKLDNRRANLRPCTNQQNQMNRGANKNNTSGYKGVAYDKRRSKYSAQIRYNRKLIWLGYYPTAEDAYGAYKAKAAELFKEFAHIGKTI